MKVTHSAITFDKYGLRALVSRHKSFASITGTSGLEVLGALKRLGNGMVRWVPIDCERDFDLPEEVLEVVGSMI